MTAAITNQICLYEAFANVAQHIACQEKSIGNESFYLQIQTGPNIFSEAGDVDIPANHDNMVVSINGTDAKNNEKNITLFVDTTTQEICELFTYDETENSVFKLYSKAGKIAVVIKNQITPEIASHMITSFVEAVTDISSFDADQVMDLLAGQIIPENEPEARAEWRSEKPMRTFDQRAAALVARLQ
ncbi:MAG: hypothetical protein AAF569_03295 [Pseudomonadota bacterium]